MALLDVQTVICRSLLSRRFRESMARAPELACRDYSLTADELAGLSALPLDQIEKNARYIHRLRLGQVQRRFPLTDLVVKRAASGGEAFYDGWLEALTHETNTQRENATSFLEYVCRREAERPGELPSYLPDLAESEYRKCRVREGWNAPEDPAEGAAVPFDAADPAHSALRPVRRHVVEVQEAAHDVVELTAWLEKGERGLPSVPSRPTHVLIVQDRSVKGSVRLLRADRRASRLVGLCDGATTVAEIAGRFRKEAPGAQGDEVERTVREGLARLQARRWVRFVR